MEDVEVLIFDVFGTVVDWRSSVVDELRELGKKHSIEEGSVDWEEFAQDWRTEYFAETKRIADGGSGAASVDVMHRQILDAMLSFKWAHVGERWDEAERRNLNNVWHRLRPWPDVVEGLNALKKTLIITTLSNGNMRLLIDLARYGNLPWDTIFSGELFNSYKPNPKTYLGVAHHLSLPPEKCAMVAAHDFDVRAAAALGLRTVYVPRPGEGPQDVKSKKDGGEFDVVVSSFTELAAVLKA